jgi:MoaA/NifB/PqqE/SkfB family radical SAM enzyme
VIQLKPATEKMFHAEIEATSLCNTRCLHCPHEAISRPGGKMTWETYTTVIEKIRNHVNGEQYSVSYSGMGEPLLNPLIYKFIKHISHEALTAFSSNGAALTEQNVLKLIEAGMDTIYLSFNGDEAEVYTKMMGGLSFDRGLANMRRAVELAKGTQLKIRANVSITKANQDRVSSTHAFLDNEGVGPVSFSLCHNRGGNLDDVAVCDTPALGVENWACDVMKNTLTVDWQGKVHICEHDLHGEYELGDLMKESLDVVLERRQKLLKDSRALEICRGCNDVLRAADTPPLDSMAGGLFRDWIYDLYKDTDDPLSEANEVMKWIFKIYLKEGRTDRLANRFIAIEKEGHKKLQEIQAALASLHLDRLTILKDNEAIKREKESIQATLDERDRQYAELHAEWTSMRKDSMWRFVSMIRRDIRRLFGASKA